MVENNKSRKGGNALLYTVSAIALVAVCGLILTLSLLWPSPDKNESSQVSGQSKASSDAMSAEEYLASSSAIAGEASEDIEREMTAEALSGKYVDERDGWCYKFEYNPTEAYDGSFYAAFETAIDSGQGDILNGTWKLENGEIKLFGGDVYLESLWAHNDCVVDSKAFFVGNISPGDEYEQTMLVCKDSETGDVRVLNLYNDGKVVFEISKLPPEGTADSSASAETNPAILQAGTYVKNGDKITVTINGAATEYKIVDGGLASWFYVKRVDENPSV